MKVKTRGTPNKNKIKEVYDPYCIKDNLKEYFFGKDVPTIEEFYDVLEFGEEFYSPAKHMKYNFEFDSNREWDEYPWYRFLRPLVSTEEKHFLGPKVFQIREISGSRKCHYCKEYEDVKFMNKFEFDP